MTDLLKTIKFLEQQQKNIVFESYEDMAAEEYWCHLADVIDDLKSGAMTIQEAGESLGMKL